MRKVKIEDDSQLNGIEISYPFCFKTKKNTYGDINYYRYLEDGRYEHICVQELQIHLSFGNHSNTIYSLVGDHEFYFKQLALKHEIITSEEFDEERNKIYERYNEYLQGTKYIASEVEKMIEESHDSIRKDSLIENGIIENKNDVPF